MSDVISMHLSACFVEIEYEMNRILMAIKKNAF